MISGKRRIIHSQPNDQSDDSNMLKTSLVYFKSDAGKFLFRLS